MTPRSRSLMFAIVTLTTLAIPSAAAVGEEVYAVVADVQATANSALVDVQEMVVVSLEPRQEEAAREQQEEQYSQPPAEEHREREVRQAPPSDRSTIGGSLLAPVDRLLPIPVTDAVGAAPRVDLSSLVSDVIPLTPLAPASGDAGAAPLARTAAPVAPAAAPDSPASALPATPAALAVAVTVAAAAAAPAAASAFWERLRNLGFLALLYSRIAKERLLDHGSRERLLDAIRARPGLAVADLAEVTGAPRNTVTYHLRVLEREGLVSSTRNGRNRLYFAPGSLPQRANADAFATLRHETTLAIARAIGETPGVDQKALCDRVGVSPSLAHWHADRLVASGLVDKRREGRFVRYYPGASFELVTARAA